MATVQFQDPLGRIVQKVAIVGHAHHCPGKFLQKLLEPLHALRIQVVGRLIKQQHVWLGEQQPAKRHAAFLATRQRAHLGIPGGQTQCVGRNFHLGFHVVRPT